MKSLFIAPTALVALVLIAHAAIAQSACPATASVFHVNSTLDVVDADTNDGLCATATTPATCTLRAAIMQANACPGKDTILVPSGIYTLSIVPQTAPTDADGDLNIIEAVVIKATGAGPAIIDGAAIDRVFNVAVTKTTDPQDGVISEPGSDQAPLPPAVSPDVRLEGLVIRNGNPGTGKRGGGLLVDNSALTLVRDSIIYNSADEGGGLAQSGESTSRTTVYNSTIAHNFALVGGGGGTYLDGSKDSKLYLYFSTIADNVAATEGGGSDTPSNGSNADGFKIADTIIARNTAGSVAPLPDDCFVESQGYPALDATLSIIQTAGNWSDPLVPDDATDMHETVLEVDPGLGFLAPLDSISLDWTSYVLRILSSTSMAVDRDRLALETQFTGTGYANNIAPCGLPQVNPDARRALRNVDGDRNGISACDLGAVEYLGHDVRVEKTVSKAIANIGDSFAYVITVTNLGEPVTSAFTVADDVPAQLQLLSATSTAGLSCTSAAQHVSCAISAMGLGQSLSTTVTVKALHGGTITNSASTVTPYADDDATNDHAEVTSTVISLSNTTVTITETPPDPAPGDRVTYTITATNAGPDSATNVVVTDPIPACITVVSATPSQGTCTVGKDVCTTSDQIVVTCELGTIANAAAAGVSIVATAGAQGDCVNTVGLSQSEGNPSGGSSATVTTTIKKKTPGDAAPLGNAFFRGGACGAAGPTWWGLALAVFLARRRRSR